MDSDSIGRLSVAELEQLAPPKSPFLNAVQALRRHRSGMIGLIIVTTMGLISLLSPLLAPFDPLEMHAADRFHPPSAPYYLGTDEFGRDILSRILIGSRVAFSVGLLSIGIAAVVGVTIGLVAGYGEGKFDAVVMRLLDAVLAFPAILLAIVILAVLGPSSLNATLAIAIVTTPAFARLTRANVLTQKHKDYVEASRALGASPTRIIFAHILPNSISTILVLITVAAAGAILLESALSFLGLGTPLPAPSWGSMLSAGRGYLFQAPWYGIFPGLAIMILVMGFYLLGDGLRDVFDPRRRTLGRAVPGTQPDRLSAFRALRPGRGRASEEYKSRTQKEQMTDANTQPLLGVNDLHTYFFTEDGVVKAVDGADLYVEPGEVLALVGESGCGKSVTALSIMRLIDRPGKTVNGHITFEGRSVLALSEAELAEMRGRHMSMIFQQPQSCLNPLFTVGDQVAEVLRIHSDMGKEEAWEKAVELLRLVGIADAEKRAFAYPHEMSGGQAQRVMISMALALSPQLLLADEPTTALDVTIQAQILDLIRELNSNLGTAVLLITHDLGVVAEMADRVAVMYAGSIMEVANVKTIFAEPLHPYTQGLIESIPIQGQVRNRLNVIPGGVPNLIDLPAGCRFAPRCRARAEYELTICTEVEPELMLARPEHKVRCWLYHDHDGYEAPLMHPQTETSFLAITSSGSV